MSRIQNKKSPVQQIIINPADDGRRIDNFIMGRFSDLPRARVYQMLRRGEVRVNKGRVKQSYRLQTDDIVRIPPLAMVTRVEPGKPPAYLLNMLKSGLLYEDKHIIALNKPSGIVVHSGSGRSFGVIEILRYLRPDDTELQLAHRIDQATSGCLLLAKTTAGLRQLHQALRGRQVKKHYIALLRGDIGQQEVRVNKPLKKNTVLSGERLVQVDTAGKAAESRFTRRQVYQDSCLVDVLIDTGRTHQIRVHSRSMGNAVAGDDKYGDRDFNRALRRNGLKRLFLHASRLELPEYTNEGLTIKAPLSADLQEFLRQHV